MTDDGNVGIFHYINISLCILFRGSRLDRGLMHTGNHIVQRLEYAVIQVQAAVSVQNIRLGAVEHAHAQPLPLRISQIAEIGCPAAAQRGGTVVGYSEHFQIAGSGCLCHVGDRGAGTVSAGDRMGMNIQFISFGKNLSICCMADLTWIICMMIICHKQCLAFFFICAGFGRFRVRKKQTDIG